jgi:5'-deoxynucleotidase YfbR-like HD superfamily hydrolase
MTEPTTDRVGVRGSTIVTRSGVYFDFENPDPATIHIEDIAWALAHTCRYGGHTTAFYSVAQHSVMVCRMVPPWLALTGLLHDASEAYVGDVVKPLKLLLPGYREIERRVERAIAERFGLFWPWHPAIKHADLRALRTEQRDVTAAASHAWPGVDYYEPLDARIRPLPPLAAARLFLRWFDTLTSARREAA